MQTISPSATPPTPLNLEALTLQQGSHSADSGDMCLLEAVSVFSGEPFGYHPSCACPTLAQICRSWNDNACAANRQLLKQYIPLLPGTFAGEALSDQRTTQRMVTSCQRVPCPNTPAGHARNQLVSA
jgi:hypothetical protein